MPGCDGRKGEVQKCSRPTWYGNQGSRLWPHLPVHTCALPGPPGGGASGLVSSASSTCSEFPDPPACSPGPSCPSPPIPGSRRWPGRRVIWVLDPALSWSAGQPPAGCSLLCASVSSSVRREGRTEQPLRATWLPGPYLCPAPPRLGGRQAHLRPPEGACASPYSKTTRWADGAARAGASGRAQGGPGAAALTAAPPRSATCPCDPHACPGLRWGPSHRPLGTAQHPAPRSVSCPGSLGTIPGPSPPQPRAGDSPGRSTFHLGPFWSMGTDRPSPCPGPAASEQLPLARGRGSGAAGPGGAERTPLSPAAQLQESAESREPVPARPAGGPPSPRHPARAHPRQLQPAAEGWEGGGPRGEPRPLPALPVGSGCTFEWPETPRYLPRGGSP